MPIDPNRFSEEDLLIAVGPDGNPRLVQCNDAGDLIAAVTGGGDATAANQTTEIARLTSILSALGGALLATIGTAVSDTDAVGDKVALIRTPGDVVNSAPLAVVPWAYDGATLDRIRTSVANGMQVDPTRLPAGEIHLGSVGGDSTVISPAVTVSTSPAYSAGDVVGGKLTLTNALRVSGGTGLLQSLLLIDTSNQKAALDIYFFDSDPTAGTYTDNAAVAFSTDTAKLIRKISVAASDYVTNNSIAVADLSPGSRVLKANGSANLYAVIVNGIGTPTYAATTALTLRVGILRD